MKPSWITENILRNKLFFKFLKKVTNGMMSPWIYRLLYKTAREIRRGDIIEVGAGHGASTVSLGLGLKDINSDRKVYTIEKCEGGSRSDFGGKQTNLEILKNNIGIFGLQAWVEILPKKLVSEADLPREINKIGLMFLDADGRIDRDFRFFYNRIVPGGSIIIDDYEEQKDFCEKSIRYPLGGTKEYRTFCYLNYFKEKGFFEQKCNYAGTVFGIKPTEIKENVNFNEEELGNVEDKIKKEYNKAGFDKSTI